MNQEKKNAPRKLRLAKETVRRLDPRPQGPQWIPITISCRAIVSCNVNCSMTCAP